MKVWLTGGAGWLGSRLVECLLEGLDNCVRAEQLHCLVLPTEAASLHPAARAHVGDLRDPAACESFLRGSEGGLLIHLAGVIHPGRVRDFYSVNVQGTANLLKEAQQRGIARALVMSSNSPCGCNPHPDHLFDEDSPYRPYMGYGRSKMQMERLVADFEGFERVILRAPWFYGLNQPPRQTQFFRMVRSGRFPLIGKGDNLRSMSYIDNLCQGILRAAVHPGAAGQTYWLADRRPYSMLEIAETVKRVLSRDFGLQVSPGYMRLPAAIGPIATLADYTLQRLGIYQHKIHVLSELDKTIACRIDKARQELGYEPRVELEEGMRRSVAWCLEKDYQL